jgi:hypothetical protein
MKESVFKIGDNKTEQLLKLDDENLIKYFDLIVESFNDDICYIITEYFVVNSFVFTKLKIKRNF